MITIKFSKSDIPLGAVLVCKITNTQFEWGEKTLLPLNSSISLTSSNAISRHVARLNPSSELYPLNILHRTEVDHWLTLCSGPLGTKNISSVLNQLNSALAPSPFLTSGKLTIADLEAFVALYKSQEWHELQENGKAPPHVLRWYNHVKAKVDPILKSLPTDILSNLSGSKCEKETSVKREDGGKFVELPGAKMGEVVVRFPPEASGYLHIGHAKAALLNQYYQKTFKGKLVMRFDDTNPEKEKADFEKVILEDLKLLDVKPDIFSFTSDHFEKMLELCEYLLKNGKAYVDDTEGEVMKKEREEKKESKNRNNSIETNLKMWEDMKSGSESGQKCCVRAKIDMNSPNGCMRDPTIYRCKNEPHPRTGDKFKVYPTYDFACPIVDSVEGVTHALRTTEYHDRDDQFFWFIKELKLRPLNIYEYSRLNMNNTVLSKRKLTWFVNEGLVEGWDDPRFPTVRGILRRGMTIEGLKDFIIAQGSSRSVVNMEWDKIWSFNKKVIDREASRYTALQGSLVAVIIKGVEEECKEAQKHPKDPSKGMKAIWVGPKIFIESVDAEELKEGENATFINWGNLKITKIHRKDGKIDKVEAEPNLANTDFKKTLKLTWLPESSNAPWTPVICSYFDHIITKSVLSKDEDFKQFVNPCTRNDIQMVGDHELKKLNVGDIIQLQRKGFFRVDASYKPFNASSCKESPVLLIYIPDGHTKEVAALSSKKSDQKGTKVPSTENKEEIIKDSKITLISKDDGIQLHLKIKEQGDKIRKLKSDKVEKSIIMEEVEVLKTLKMDFKNLTGIEWTPDFDDKCLSEKSPKSSPSPMEGNVLELHNKIKNQGNKIRELKAEKADKSTVKEQVDILLSLKNEFKAVTNVEWKPDIDIQSVLSIHGESSNESANIKSSGELILRQIKDQGDKVRSLKAAKAEKDKIKSEVDILLNLKKEFHTVTGTEWKPDIDLNKLELNAVTKTCSNGTSRESGNAGLDIHKKIKCQGDKVRILKSEKADKDTIKAEVNILLSLKADFKNITGKDWNPDVDVSNISSESPKPVLPGTTSSALEIHNKIKEQGDKVRNLKAQKASKDVITEEVNKLLSLKNEFKSITNIDWKPDIDPSSFSQSKRSSPVSVQAKVEKKQKTESKVEDSLGKKQTRLGLEAKKNDNLSDWYSQVITKSEMIEYYNVSGCYILRPWSYSIWELIKNFLDAEIKKLGVENSYFPIFVSKDALEKEKTHIDDFSPEVAWVTKSGSSDMAEPVAIRPTSETVMYPAFAKWIQSHRDLPIKINQWNNIVRWEFKQPTPFLRTREFLWQEGHTAFATKEEACNEVYKILELYARIYEELLAIPVVKGHKTKKEQFAGGDFTTTTEAFISASGRAIQGATSHHLGQNFSKMFEIIFEDPKTQEKKYVYQNSWGITTRTIGVMVMVHGDDKGLVLPPMVAPVQVIIMPVGITSSTTADVKETLLKYCTSLETELKNKGIRARSDFKDNVTPAWKFNHWELKGVPIRIEIGPRELSENKVFAVRRDNGEKQSLDRMFIERRIYNLLELIQNDMYERAQQDLISHKKLVNTWVEFVETLNKGNIILAPFCGVEECEDTIKKDSARDDPSDAGAPSMGAKGLCIPFEQPGKIDGLKCINPKCCQKPKFYTLFGRSY